jgi:DMSO/TMAO reductase YedYZ molybdopterin-dependent catalytic subunit
VPPGQYLTRDFPVLATGPTPHARVSKWSLAITRGATTLASWNWEEFTALPAEDITVDIHCVTRWSKLDTRWRGVPVQSLLGAVDSGYVMAHSDGGYTTNVPVKDLIGGQAWVAYSYGGAPLPPEHGGPARLLIPHLYFWKSAKWVRRLDLMDTDQPGFWEVNGYNMYGDPWREQRYTND